MNKSKLGNLYKRHLSNCERILDKIDGIRYANMNMDIMTCSYCGVEGYGLHRNGSLYECSNCRIVPVEINETGKLWSF